MAGSPPTAPAGSTAGLDSLLQLIAEVAEGRQPVQSLIDTFRSLHERLERAGRPAYRSKDEARLIWDLLWALEFYSADPSRESNPAEWNDSTAILAEAQRVHRRLQAL